MLSTDFIGVNEFFYMLYHQSKKSVKKMLKRAQFYLWKIKKL